MTISLPLIWKQHDHRENFNECPHCGKPLRWIYNGEKWLPCDAEPVLFTMHPSGRMNLVHKKEVLEKCLLYNSKDPRCAGSPIWGYQQHFYTCEWLRERRKRYIEQRKGETP